jgi:hypothetical protein
MVVEKWRRNHERPQDAIRADYWRFDMKSRFWTSAAGLAAACVTQCALADDDGPRTAGSLPRAQTSITGPQNPAAAQAGSPSWQTAPASAQSKGATGPMGNERTVASKPPTDRDCKSVVTKPDQGYAPARAGGFYTDGTQDHGRILNEVSTTGRVVQVNLEDLQVRIEQLRCEDQNIKAKLDYLIRLRTP